jgi:hypothetical protein
VADVVEFGGTGALIVVYTVDGGYEAEATMSEIIVASAHGATAATAKAALIDALKIKFPGAFSGGQKIKVEDPLAQWRRKGTLFVVGQETETGKYSIIVGRPPFRWEDTGLRYDTHDEALAVKDAEYGT